jgi:hypothetical protein
MDNLLDKSAHDLLRKIADEFAAMNIRIAERISKREKETPATEHPALPQITSLTVSPQNAPLAFQDIDCSRDDYRHGISGGRLA